LGKSHHKKGGQKQLTIAVHKKIINTCSYYYDADFHGLIRKKL